MNKEKIKKEIKYKKGNVYQYVDNSIYEDNEKYKAEIYTTRELNPKTEKYEYKTEIINHKLNWEQEEQKLKQLYQLEELKEKGSK